MLTMTRAAMEGPKGIVIQLLGTPIQLNQMCNIYLDDNRMATPSNILKVLKYTTTYLTTTQVVHNQL